MKLPKLDFPKIERKKSEKIPIESVRFKKISKTNSKKIGIFGHIANKKIVKAQLDKISKTEVEVVNDELPEW